MLTVEFTVLGVPRLGLQGGPAFGHGEAFLFQVATDDRAETDRCRGAVVADGAQGGACGWCKDKRCLPWQITPRVPTGAMAGGCEVAELVRGDGTDEEDRLRRDRGGGARVGIRSPIPGSGGRLDSST